MNGTGPGKPRHTDAAAPPWGPPEQVDLARRLRAGIGAPFDLIVVGAGITGAGGVARRGAERLVAAWGPAARQRPTELDLQ